MFQTAVHFLHQLVTCLLKTWFELHRVKLQKMYKGNPGEIDFGQSQRKVRVSEGLSHLKSTVHDSNGLLSHGGHLVVRD